MYTLYESLCVLSDTMHYSVYYYVLLYYYCVLAKTSAY